MTASQWKSQKKKVKISDFFHKIAYNLKNMHPSEFLIIYKIKVDKIYFKMHWAPLVFEYRVPPLLKIEKLE